MATFLAGFGITMVVLAMIFAGVVAFAGIIATIRAAINDGLGSFSKVIWILANLFIPGAAFLYFAFVDSNGFLKFVGWVCILFFMAAALLGGTAIWGGIEGLKREFETGPGWHFETWSTEDPVNKPGQKALENSDDSSIAL